MTEMTAFNAKRDVRVNHERPGKLKVSKKGVFRNSEIFPKHRSRRVKHGRKVEAVFRQKSGSDQFCAVKQNGGGMRVVQNVVIGHKNLFQLAGSPG